MKYLWALLICLGACTPSLVNPADITPITAIPTPSFAELCLRSEDTTQAIDMRLNALTTLYRLDVGCGERDIALELYVIYLEQGRTQEAQGQPSEALLSYHEALLYLPSGADALAQVAMLTRSTQVALSCDPAVIEEAHDSLSAYVPSDLAPMIFDTETGFMLDDMPYRIFGANYYPRDTPFRLFLTETDVNAVEQELRIIRPTGINTLRIFLRYADLFICPNDGAIPMVANFERLDALIQTIANQQFRVIIVLNHDPDLRDRPLYTDSTISDAQTQFIVQRYRNEPAILAWDMRDRGDVDYRNGGFSRETVLMWLAHTAILIRQIDSNHPITAGWWQDADATTPLVDFVSFQFYGEYEQLRQTIANLRASVNKPILLSAIGYSTFAIDETAQRNLLYQAFEEVAHNDLMGWMVYMAFDFPRTVTCTPPNCPGTGNIIDHYGIWNTSYFPKLAVDAVQQVTGILQQ